MRKNILRISWVIGILLFAFLIYKISPIRIWENIKNLTLQKFLILFLLHFLYFVFRTVNWKIVFEKYEEKASFSHLIAARIAGDAISYLTPSAYLGGEPVRAIMATTANRGKSFASVIIDKTIEILTIVLLVIVGVVIAITQISMPDHYKFLFVVFVIGASLFALFLTVKQRKGFLTWIVKALEKIKIMLRFIEKKRGRIEEIDFYISDFYRNHRKTFLLVFLLYSLEFLFWTGEIFLTLLFINAKGATFLDSFLITTLGSLVIIMPTVPASFGTYEVTYVAIFILLGLGADVGITLTLIRRIVGLSWAGIGLLLMLKRRMDEPG